MPSYIDTVVLEFSEDPLSDATPTWTDVTSYLRYAEWWAGIDSDADEPQPGGAVFVLKNVNRDWEPDNTAGRFSPNVTTMRRFRLTLDGVQEGVWFAQDFAIDYPAGTGYSEVTVTCADGTAVLAMDALPLLDPPDAESYEDVIAFDEPWGYFRLGEQEGTKLVSHLRVSRRGKGKRRRKIKRRWKTEETRAEFSGVAGPAGTYVNTPLLGQPGAILGDSDTAVEFRAAQSERTKTAVNAEDFRGLGQLTVQAWIKVTAAPSSDIGFVSGPENTVSGGQIFTLTAGPTSFRFIVLEDAAGPSVPGAESSTAPNVDVWTYVVGTWDGSNLRIYIDGELEGTEPCSAIANGDDGLVILASDGTTTDCVLDEVAIVERALSAERIANIYTAATERGFPEQTAGARIAAIATSPLWAETSIQTTGRDVQPEMMHGQSRLEMIAELAHAEGPRTLFWFNGDGNPVYLGHEWQATGTYNTVQATFGDTPGETPYRTVELVYDNETYNEVTASHESGEGVTVADTAAQDDKGRRVNTDWTDVLLVEHSDVIHLANDVLGYYLNPALRPVALEVDGSHALTQILTRDLGDLIRVRKRGEGGGLAADRVTHIIGKRKTLDQSKHLTCRWTLARGFNAAADEWQLGIDGFSELGETTVLA